MLRLHQFCLGTLICYYYLHHARVIREERPWGFTLYGGFGRSKEKHFVTNSSPLLFPTSGTIYSPWPFQGASKRHEGMYHLPTVMDRSQYPSAKKRYARLNYPLRFLDLHGIEVQVATQNDLQLMEDLHRRWTDRKLADPKTHKLSFTSARYWRCVEVGLMDPGCYTVLVGRKLADGSLAAVRVVYREGDTAYDLAFFGWWEPSHISEYLNFAMMCYLYGQGVEYFNTGDPLNARLAHYKQHYPSTELTYYTKTIKTEGITTPSLL